MKDDQFNDLISIEEAAIHANLSKRHMRLLIREGKILGRKIGRDWITTKTEVNKYISTNRKPGPKRS